MEIPYNPITAKDAEIFSVDSIHQQYWKDFCDVCYPRFGFESKEDGERSYDQKYETFRQCHVFAMQQFEWNEAMMFKVHEQDLQRFQEAYEFFTNLSNDDNAAIPMLTVLLRIQQSIWNRLREDRQMMEYIYPRNCNISCEKYKIEFVANSPVDEHVVKDMDDLEKSILDKLYFERDWDYGWQQDISKAMVHQVDYYNDEKIEWDETAGSLTQRLAETIINSYNYSLSTFESEYEHLVTARHGSVIHAIVYRLFMSYQTSLDEIKSIIEDYPAEICLAKLTDVRNELIEEFKKNKLGKHWYECVKSQNGLEKVGRFLINHRNTISEEEEERFFYSLDEICIITDILKGNAKKYWLNVDFIDEPYSGDDTKCTLENRIFKKNHNGKPIDFQALHKLIETSFVAEIKYGYEWFALWRILYDLRLLEDTTLTSFAEQMNKWYPNAKKSCNADNMGDYHNPYLGTTAFVQWDEDCFASQKTIKQSIGGYRRLYNDCETIKEALNSFFK